MAGGVFHDPDLFDGPGTFRTRALPRVYFWTKPGADITGFRDNFAFRAGRRICPGERMGRRTAALNAMNLVWAFDFSPLNKESFTMEMNRYIEPGIELAPRPFECNVKVRGDGRAAMIKSAFASSSK
ncbi:hypothetical protein BYT27DRAFT_6541167 [Phlegmacium glaucopus]|nr:hypothetical protein BYT27DRAFT_6541167 [Phlegmacium glaucopus]